MNYQTNKNIKHRLFKNKKKKNYKCVAHRLRSKSYMNEFRKFRDEYRSNFRNSIIEVNAPISHATIEADSTVTDSIRELALNEIAIEKEMLKPTLNSASALSEHVISLLSDIMGKTIVDCDIDELRQTLIVAFSHYYGFDEGCHPHLKVVQEEPAHEEQHVYLEDIATLSDLYTEEEDVFEEKTLDYYFEYLHEKEYEFLDDECFIEKWVINKEKQDAYLKKYGRIQELEQRRQMYKEILVYKPMWDMLYGEDIEEAKRWAEERRAKQPQESPEEIWKRVEESLYRDDEDDDAYYCEIDGLFDENSYTDLSGKPFRLFY